MLTSLDLRPLLLVYLPPRAADRALARVTVKAPVPLLSGVAAARTAVPVRQTSSKNYLQTAKWLSDAQSVSVPAKRV